MQPRPLGPSTSSLARLALVLAALSLLPPIATGQTAKLSCPYFFDNLHQATDCLEAVFSEDDKPLYTHLTVGSVPPALNERFVFVAP
jgi:hypothetical protein